MVLTNKQEEGLKIALKRYRDKELWTCIAGYAGTGKSTLIKFIIAALNLDESEVCYVAYTGKASLVLKGKGCPNAMTAHRLLYKSYQKNDGTFYHKPKDNIGYYKLIVVDEISMLPQEMWDLLLSHKIHVIALGDPGQLPPIGQPNHVLDSPHIFLDEIMRQAQESEIIRLTMDIREGKPLKPFKGNEVQIIPKEALVDGMLYWADQVIVATNSNRRTLNSMMRKKLLGVENEVPVPGDKVICLRNYWDSINENEDVLVNGSIGKLTTVDCSTRNKWLNPVMKASFLPEQYTAEELENSSVNLTFPNLGMDYQLFTTGEPTVNKNNFLQFPKLIKPLEFDYGYAITCWKSQGSEYGKVLLFEEGFPFSAEDHKKYLYTGATRACDKLVIVQK